MTWAQGSSDHKFQALLGPLIAQGPSVGGGKTGWLAGLATTNLLLHHHHTPETGAHAWPGITFPWKPSSGNLRAGVTEAKECGKGERLRWCPRPSLKAMDRNLTILTDLASPGLQTGFQV